MSCIMISKNSSRPEYFVTVLAGEAQALEVDLHVLLHVWDLLADADIFGWDGHSSNWTKLEGLLEGLLHQPGPLLAFFFRRWTSS